MRYAAVVLSARSRADLLARFGAHIPPGWAVDADHMTVNLGPAEDGPAAGQLGQTVPLTVVSFAVGEQAVAVGVECPVPSRNPRPHITLAVNTTAGGRSRDANALTEWVPVEPLLLSGTVLEVD
jgi:hypothetical protein